jgi:hypothetical protein
VPALGPVIVKVVDPAISPCVVSIPPSILNDTPPVGVPAAELTVTVTIPFALYVTVGAPSVIVVAPTPTPRVPKTELAPKFPCAVYVANKEWLPRLRLELGIMKVVDPPASTCVVAAPPSTLNDTFPVGVPAAELTVTVTLPSVPYVTAGAVIVVVVAAGFTIRVPEAELAPKVPCAAYAAFKV